MTIYIKCIGFNDFASAEVSIRNSNKGFKIATLTKVTRISKRKFYDQPEHLRFRLSVLREGYEVHEIGMGDFFDRLEGCYNGQD